MESKKYYTINVTTGDVDENGNYTNCCELKSYSAGTSLENARLAMEQEAAKHTADFGEYVEVAIFESDEEDEEGDILEWRQIEHEYRDLRDAIVVYWSWQTYVGYARKFEGIEVYYGNADESATIEKDHTFVRQMSVVAWPEELEGLTDEEKREKIIEKLDTFTKWQNPIAMKNMVNEMF